MALKLEVTGRILFKCYLVWCVFLFSGGWFQFLVQLGSIVGIFWIGWWAIDADGLIWDEMSGIYCIAVCFQFCTFRCWHLPKVNVKVLGDERKKKLCCFTHAQLVVQWTRIAKQNEERKVKRLARKSQSEKIIFHPTLTCIHHRRLQMLASRYS